jgi:AAA+ ATPase superfamily predicted ATPase
VYGRRRVGKTFLIRTILEKSLAFEFVGVHHADMKMQLENFSRALTKAAHSPAPFAVPRSWGEAFDLLEKYLIPIVAKKRTAIFFDEFPWIHTPKSNFLKAFDHFWNTWASKQKNLTMVICGSAASWMIKNIVNDKGGLHNRLTERIRLTPYNLYETEAYFKSQDIRLDRYQIVQLYMAMGGIPQYLSGVRKGESAEQAIDRICFTKPGYLTDEFKNLYASLFDSSTHHDKLIRALAKTPKGLTRNELLAEMNFSSGGTLTAILEELQESGFITGYIPLGKKAKDTVWKLTDEYSLFYIKYIERNISSGKGTWFRICSRPSWKSWSGFAFETVCLQHEEQIKSALGLTGIFVSSSIWRHSGSSTTSGAQIDLLLDRSDRVINLCEMKFSGEQFTLTKKYTAELETKKNVFVTVTGTPKTVFITLITSYGTLQNEHYRKTIQNELTLDDLFKKE